MRTPLLKKTIIFLAVFLALVLGLFLSRPSWRFWEKKPNLLAINSVNKESLNQLVVTKEGSETKIAKINSQWQIGNFKADEKVVSNCLDLLLSLKKDTLASTNKEKFSKYDISDKSSKIKLASGNKMSATVLIGKSGPTYGTNYFQIEGEDRVWLSGDNLVTACQPPEWRDMTIFSFDTQKVKSYQLQESGNNYTLKKNGVQWELDGQANKKMVGEKVSSILYAFASLKAKDLLVAEKDTSQFSAVITATVTLEDEKKYSLQIGAPLTNATDSDFKAKSEDEKIIYLISST
ncbi:MAG: DUF4340 domain-containing protein, partial [bacterium]|nr:DUF4340 domain-containing protein [bacterium]